MNPPRPAFYVLLFTFLALLYSLTVPLFEGNDESWHYAYVWHIAEGKGLPRQPPDRYPHLARQEASQPPLYYLLAAALTRWVPQEDLPALYERENPFPTLLPIGHRDNQNHYIHTDAERFPYRGAALAIRLARLLSVLFGAGTVWGTYRLARKLFPQEEGVAVGAAMAVALTPGFLFTSGLVNNDALLACIATWTLVVLAPHPSPCGRGGRRRQRGWGEAGLLLGAAALTKLSGLLLWPFAALMLAWTAGRRRDVSLLLRGGLLVFGVALAVCGWWYGRNWHLYGDPTGLAAMLPLVGRREPGFGLMDFFQTEARLVWMSYWAVFGWFNLAAPGWVYRVYGLLTALGLAGLVLFVARSVRRRDRDALGRMGYLVLWALIVAVGLVRWTLTTGGSQGRLLYPAVGAHAALLALGWAQLVPAQARRWLFPALGGLLLALALWLPFGVIRPAYALPAPRTILEVEKSVSQQTEVRFGEGIRLLGYRVEAEEVRPGQTLWVTLCWHTDRPIPADYFVSLSLLTAEGLTAGQKVTHPGLGTFPTSLWPPGVAFCDRYPLPVRETVPTTTVGTLAVGLTTFTERLPVYNKDWWLGDTFHFRGPVVTVLHSGPVLDYRWGHEVALVGYRLERAVLAPGEELDLTLYWRALRPFPGPRSASVQVLRDGGYKIAQVDLPLNLEPGEVWADHRRMPLATDAPPGVYEIGIAVYDPTSGGALPVYEHGRALPAGRLLPLWEVRVTEPPPYAGDVQNPGEIRADVRFGDIIHLTGYTLSSYQARPGDWITVTLYWELLNPVDRPLNGFVHLLGTTVNPATGNLLWGQADRQLPVNWWEAGKVYEDAYPFQIAPDAPAGEYRLEVGWWDPYTWERYPPDVVGGEAVLSEWNSVLLRSIRIP